MRLPFKICVTGSGPPLREITQILRSLWRAGIRTGIVEANESNDAQDMAKDLGAVNIILFGEDGSLRVRSWRNDNLFREQQLNRQELTAYIQKILRPDHQSGDISQTNPNPSIKRDFLTGPEVEVTFSTPEKLNANMRRRYENQLKQHMSQSLSLFGKKDSFKVIVVELPSALLKAITGAIDLRNISNKETDDEISVIIEKFPKYKRYTMQIVEDIIKVMADITEKKTSPIIGMYSISDSSYRIMLW